MAQVKSMFGQKVQVGVARTREESRVKIEVTSQQSDKDRAMEIRQPRRDVASSGKWRKRKRKSLAHEQTSNEDPARFLSR
eukprot:6191057-Pleurochrysis_carterae.AAC.2